MTQLTDAERAAKALFGDRRKVWRLYQLARKDLIPHVRLGKRTILFDLERVRSFLAAGGGREPGCWRRCIEPKVGSVGVNP